VAPSNASAAPSKIADTRVGCLRWHTKGLYVCAAEPTDPYSLGFAAEPTRGFAPLWHRANTCRDACTPPSSLEQRCREPWEAIAPLVGAEVALCNGDSVMPNASIDAGSSAVDSGLADDDRENVAASPPTSQPTAMPPPPPGGNCSVTSPAGLGTRWWLALVPMLAGGLRRRRSRGLRAAADPNVNGRRETSSESCRSNA